MKESFTSIAKISEIANFAAFLVPMARFTPYAQIFVPVLPDSVFFNPSRADNSGPPRAIHSRIRKKSHYICYH